MRKLREQSFEGTRKGPDGRWTWIVSGPGAGQSLALFHFGAGGFEDLAFAGGEALNAMGGDFIENWIHLPTDELIGRKFGGLALGSLPGGIPAQGHLHQLARPDARAG